jgi:hypothetical protein
MLAVVRLRCSEYFYKAAWMQIIAKVDELLINLHNVKSVCKRKEFTQTYYLSFFFAGDGRIDKMKEKSENFKT